ncbi:MAG: hypothetical protein EOP84_11985 [Verrucomicrobiaceae bacterium]|nr:MAG: hypothetical protein EOP84_11985 [Verrucomicrobiaceae bacterium]
MRKKTLEPRPLTQREKDECRMHAEEMAEIVVGRLERAQHRKESEISRLNTLLDSLKQEGDAHP